MIYYYVNREYIYSEETSNCDKPEIKNDKQERNSDKQERNNDK